MTPVQMMQRACPKIHLSLQGRVGLVGSGLHYPAVIKVVSTDTKNQETVVEDPRRNDRSLSAAEGRKNVRSIVNP